MTTPLFSVIIPVFNKWELTKACLCSLKEHTPEPCEVIVVDNGSSDATASELVPLGEILFGEAFTRIRFPENRNFAPACNAGAKAAKAPLLFFLNNDTLLTEGWAPPLMAALQEDSRLGAVGPLLLYEDETVQHLGITFTLQGLAHLYRGFPGDHAVVKEKRYVQALTAAALMMPHTIFDECGGFFEEYRNSFEDVELSLRLLSLGKRLRCVPESVIYHLESKTPGRHDHEQYNSELFTRRCTHLCRIDQHQHALKDGFHPFLNMHLALSVVLRPEEEARLTDLYKDAGLQEMKDAIKKNPYWEFGPERLSSAFEKAGHLSLAVKILADYAHINPTVARLEKLLQLSEQAGLKEYTLMAREDLLVARILRQDKGQTRRKLRSILKAGEKQGDAFLRNIAMKGLEELDSAS